MSKFQDHYRILGLTRGASAGDVKRAYRTLVRQAHPDVNPGDPSADVRFNQIRTAYDVLSDPEQRAAYDRGADHDLVFRGGEPRPPSPRPGSTLGAVFRAVFGRRKGRGADLHTQVVLDFADAVVGSTVELAVRRGGSSSAEERIRVRIPPGVEDGATVRVVGKGLLGSPPGDLLVTTRTRPHDVLTRVGQDIHMVAPIAVWDAALGTSLEVATVEGGATIRIPSGTQTGRKFRLRGLGVQSRNGGGTRGDQIVEVRVQTPVLADERSRELMSELARLHGVDVGARAEDRVGEEESA